MASVRLLTPSARKMAVVCTFTVLSDMASMAAMALLALPCANRRATSSWRAVNPLSRKTSRSTGTTACGPPWPLPRQVGTNRSPARTWRNATSITAVGAALGM